MMNRVKLQPFPIHRLLGLFLAGLLVGGAGCTKKVRIDRHLARGNDFFKAEQYDQAEKEYRLVLRLDPGRAPVCSRLGLIYYAQGKWVQAFSMLRYATGVDPENLEVRLKLAAVYSTSQRLAEARDQVFAVLQKQPTNEEALLLVGDLAGTTNDLAALVRRLEELPAQAKASYAWHVARGRLWLAGSRTDNGEAELKQALALAPKSSGVHLAWADFYLRKQDLKQAETALKAAAELAPWRSPIRLTYAQLQVREGAPADAKKTVEELVKKVPDYLPGWIFLGQLAQSEGKQTDWRAMADEILGRDPANYEGLLLKGDLLLATGEGTNAVAHFEQMASLYRDAPVSCRLAAAYEIAQDTAKAVTSLNQALAADTNCVQAILMLSDIRIRNNDATAALEALNDLVQRNPQIPQAYQLMARAYLQQNKLDQAVGECRRLLALWPDDPGALTLLGSYLSLQKQVPEARQTLEKALTLAPGLSSALEKMVELDMAEGKYSAAVERVKKHIAAAPPDARPWVMLAKVYMAKAFAASTQGRVVPTGSPVTFTAATQPDLEAAKEALLKTIELQPDASTPYLLLTRLDVAAQRPQQALDRLTAFSAKHLDADVLAQAGELQQTLGKYADAAATYEKLISLNPKDGVALNNLASLYAEQLGQLEKAYPLAEQAQRLYPNSPAIADTMGWVLFRRGDYARALTLLQDSTPKLPGVVEAQFHLAMTLYMLGQEEPARLALESVAQAGQNSAAAREARRRLAVLAVDPNTADAAAIATLEKWLAESPNDILAQSRLAAIFERIGPVDKALQLYERIRTGDPKNLAVLRKLIRLYASQPASRAKALELAREAHNLTPDDAEISRTLGHLVLELAPDYKWVLSLLQQVARQLPNQPELLFDLARAYYGVGRVEQAEATMRDALKAGSFPQADAARRFLALTAAAQDPAQASRMAPEIAQILRTEPDYIPALMVSAAVARHQGNAEEAKALLEKVYASNPLFAPAARELALLYASQPKDDSRAYELALRAREVFADDPQLAKALGILCFRRGDLAGASQFLQESMLRRKEDPELFYYLGMVHYRLKAPPESKAALQRALTLKLSPELAAEAQRVIQELK